MSQDGLRHVKSNVPFSTTFHRIREKEAGIASGKDDSVGFFRGIFDLCWAVKNSYKLLSDFRCLLKSLGLR